MTEAHTGTAVAVRDRQTAAAGSRKDGIAPPSPLWYNEARRTKEAEVSEREDSHG